MIRPRYIWMSVFVCLIVVSVAMGWMSLTMIRLEQAESQLAQQSENERLALWRMDSALLPLIAQESSRPHFAYSAFYYADRAYSKMFAPIQSGAVQFPSPLLTFESPYILLHFQFGPDGKLTSPQVPTSNMRDVAEVEYTTHDRINESARRLAALTPKVSWDALVRVLSTPESQADQEVRAAVNGPPDFQQEKTDGQLAQAASPQGVAIQAARNVKEYQQRTRASQNPINDNSGSRPQLKPTGKTPVEEGPCRPIWVNEKLLLARRTRVDGKDIIQGCELNWPAIQSWLVSDVKDLLPDARLEHLAASANERGTLQLASLPVQLLPGKAAIEPIPVWSPMRLSLLLAFVCLLLSAIAVAALLRAAVQLSERRGAFVSAVTHELRTPLTTFRLYTEMLAEGIVPTEEKRQQYLETLRVEADRLGHLVENVLSYARLENSHSPNVREVISLPELLGRLESTLKRQTDRAGMMLDLKTNAETPITVRADSGAIERIVVNLVENACKYAAGAADSRIHIQCERIDGLAVISVRDHGAGISPTDAKRLFRPFSKSASEAANSAPGVGLGLALCRRLARSVGGDLKIDTQAEQGARLLFTLPAGS